MVPSTVSGETSFFYNYLFYLVMPITTVYIYSQSEDDIIHWGRMAGLHESSRQLCIIEFVDLTVFCTNKELKRKEKCVYFFFFKHFIQFP